MSACRRRLQQDNLFHVGPQRTFAGEDRAQIAFPLGGIGTGSISLGGWGQLCDFEIFNRPAKGQGCYAAFLTLFAQRQGEEAVTRVLQGPVAGPAEFPHGYPRDAGAGLPHFAANTFTGTFPLARLDFQDRSVPLAVLLEAFNPMIPMEADDSSIPAVILLVHLKNPSRTKSVKAALFANLQNLVGLPNLEGNVNEFVDEPAVRGLKMTRGNPTADAPQFGSMALTTSWRRLQVQTRWPQTPHQGEFELFWKHASQGKLSERRDRVECGPWASSVGSIALEVRLAPGQSQTLPLFITWHFPTVRKSWNNSFGLPECCTPEQPTWRNWYASAFTDAWDVARYVARNLTRLEERTRRFADTLYSSTLPAHVLDAAGSQLAVLKSTTCLRLQDGSFYGWEGCNLTNGCCEGTCSHVWNYAQALPQLFPALQASALENHLKFGLHDDGKLDFRQGLPLGVERTAPDFHGAADGQMGVVLNVYRHWKLTGDDQWLAAWWPKTKLALEYAWKYWDADSDGVMEGVQHNTYDIEFYGPNPMMTSLYLAALRAGELMAERCGQADAAERYRQIYESGRRKADQILWKNDYYVQRIDPRAGGQTPQVQSIFPVSPDLGLPPDQPPHQFGLGCLADQLIGQWYAHMLGFGYVLDEAHVRQAMKSIFRYNFRSTMLDHANTERIYALADEGGLLLCTWPRGHKEMLPFMYAHEVWSGIEYQVACHLIYEGRLTDGLKIVKAVRDRHAGYRRNPWNEVECGNHYARSMASWSLIDALSGHQWSASEQTLRFAPRMAADNFRSFFAAGTAWGAFSQKLTKGRGTAIIDVQHGAMTVSRVILASGRAPRFLKVSLGGQPRRGNLIPRDDGLLQLEFAAPVTLQPGRSLSIVW